jgi:hypothetical protein
MRVFDPWILGKIPVCLVFVTPKELLLIRIRLIYFPQELNYLSSDLSSPGYQILQLTDVCHYPF